MFFFSEDRQRLQRIEQQLEVLLKHTKQITENTDMTDIKAQVSTLLERVRNQRTVVDSVKTLVTGLRDQLLAVQGQLDAAGEAQVSASLNELAAELDAQATALAAVENTGAEDEAHADGT